MVIPMAPSDMRCGAKERESAPLSFLQNAFPHWSSVGPDHVHRSTPPCFGIHLATLRMLQRALREESEEREARSRSGRQTLDGRALLHTVSV